MSEIETVENKMKVKISINCKFYKELKLSLKSNIL